MKLPGPPHLKKTVPERLRALGDLFNQRNAAYGNDYKSAGKIMAALLPDGLFMKTEGDFCRFAIFQLMLWKLTRYSKTLNGAKGPSDSLDDLSVYAQMLQEVEQEMEN